jgi:predicted RNA methylase
MKRVKDLESFLSSIDNTFPSPNIALEQYPTSAHLASRILFSAEDSFRDIEGKRVLDLGCGTGMLSIAASAMHAGYVLGVDCDPAAIEKAKLNAAGVEADDVMDFLVCKLPQIPLQSASFDTVVMNPPFGTKSEQGADWMFLQLALTLAPVVYSLHKSTTRSFLVNRAKREFNASCQVVAELKFDLPKVYKFHKKDSVDVMVDLLRFERKPREEGEKVAE